MLVEILRATKGKRLWFIKALMLDVLAGLWRRCLRRTTFIAITGSFGKTTTKECLGSALGAHYPIVKTPRNDNAFTRVSRTLFRVRPGHRFAVVEVGTERPGMIRHWARVVRPDIAVILSVGGAHLLSFKDLDEIAAEKAKLLRGLKPGGIAVLNGDDPRVAAMADEAHRRGCEVIFFGSSPSFAVTGGAATGQWPDRFALTIRAGSESARCQTQLVGTQWSVSALGAVAVAHRLGLTLRQAIEPIEKIPPLPGRLQPVRLPNGAVILRDDTNSYLEAFTAALGVLRAARAARKIFVTNGYTEAPVNSRRRAIELGELAALVADVFVFFGQFRNGARRSAIRTGMAEESAHTFKTMQQVIAFLRTELRSGDFVVLKGRFASHIARILYALVGDVKCWVDQCDIRLLCENCPELGVDPTVLAPLVGVPQFSQAYLSPPGGEPRRAVVSEVT